MSSSKDESAKIISSPLSVIQMIINCINKSIKEFNYCCFHMNQSMLDVIIQLLTEYWGIKNAWYVLKLASDLIPEMRLEKNRLRKWKKNCQRLDWWSSCDPQLTFYWCRLIISSGLVGGLFIGTAKKVNGNCEVFVWCHQIYPATGMWDPNLVLLEIMSLTLAPGKQPSAPIAEWLGSGFFVLHSVCHPVVCKHFTFLKAGMSHGCGWVAHEHW